MNRKEVKLDNLVNWQLLINDGYEVSDELKETIATIEKGCTNTISFVILSDSVLFPIPLKEAIDYDAFELETKEAMEKTLHNPPDMNAFTLYPEGESECVGALVQMPDGVAGIVNKKDVVLKESDNSLDYICAMVAREKILDACKQEKIIGFIISNKHAKSL